MSRAVVVEQVVWSKPLRGSPAAIEGLTADVIGGMDTLGWPDQETQWWNPPFRGYVGAWNAFVAYNPATDTARAKQAKWFDEYQQQNQPLRSFPAAAQGYSVYAYASDMVRARQTKWFDEYQPQLQSLRSFAASINGNPGPRPTPIYAFGPRFIIDLPPRPFTISALTMQQFNVKDPLESVLLTFNLGPDLATGETLVGTPSINVSVVQGTDASPSGILAGLAGFDSTLSQVIVPVAYGISGTFYEVTVTCTTSNAQKTLTLSGVLPVRSIL